MKKQILFLIASLFISVASFSQARVLTDAEKEPLYSDALFTFFAKQSIRNFATYWATHDGSNMNTEADRIMWAKNRYLSVAILKNDIPVGLVNNLNTIYINAAKGKQLAYGAAPQSATTIIQTWVTNNTFEEMTQEFFKVWGDDVNMSIGN